ncbi:sulfotransferase sult [Holotrichia oblita]|uniref:Sulfotransferase sult n=1 Tax=Holotrichia oblita TaxID=644536 RepID=A0ACB9STB3_HOLOL|nr:sulfotransferase sult [Holotrichia oblita]
MAPSKMNEDEFNNNQEEKQLFPYEITRVDPEINAELLKDFTGERSYFVQVGPKNYFFPSNYEREADKFYNFEVRSDDIWIVTFPRSGTTWTQEMVWLIANDLDFETAKAINLNERCPFLEFSTFVHPELKSTFLKENSDCPVRYKIVEEVTRKEWMNLPLRKGRRIIKTHLPFTLLPQNLFKSGCKIIYVVRNPKDVIISFYYLNKLFRTQGYDGDLPTYWNYFKRNLQPWTPYWEHVKEGWDRRFEENFLFLFYEDMNRDSKAAIKKISCFLNKILTEDQVCALNEHLRIDNFKNNPSVNNELLSKLGITKNVENGFIRNGSSGNWKKELSKELNEEIDSWIEENLARTDLRFPNLNE